MKFIDLFAGMGGFHRAMSELGHECVFACEIDDELRGLYRQNFRLPSNRVHGDIRESKKKVPKHDILCAGFPCQPFSKSGYQRGQKDRTRGTLFNDILDILRERRPRHVILENVGNFERHEGGRTWRIVRESLEALGYDVRGTTHKASGGHGLVSPHHLGYPHTRERFFIVASTEPLPDDPFPLPDRSRRTSLADVVQSNSELSAAIRVETELTRQQLECIEHWNHLLARLPDSVNLPSFPIWGDELGATYPYDFKTPSSLSLKKLKGYIGLNGEAEGLSKAALIDLLPPYARTPQTQFPAWKIAFIRQNRAWLGDIGKHMTQEWIKRLRAFPPSLRKLEWNCKGEARDLWQHVLQFRPSGLRVKRYTSAPALVAMTTTQIPILGPKRRFLTNIEGLRLQGFPDEHVLPPSRARAFAALGNAVHVGVVRAIAEQAFGHERRR